jgi:DNA-binding NarL/FixJ family response regulator
MATLTGRERDIFVRLARGISNAQIAADMFLGEATVRTHVANTLSKLGLRDRVHAVIHAYESGVITPGAQDRPT